MPYRGLVQQFDVNRKLLQTEHGYRLKQKTRLSITPQARSSVIRMDSACLEITDKWFAWKGAGAILTLSFMSAIGGFYAYLLYLGFSRPDGPTAEQLIAIYYCPLFLVPFIALCSWLLLKEAFAYTHYPIRFDRQRRSVHVFRINGTVLSARWDTIFFTLGQLNRRAEFEVRGHILAEDGETVIETFPLSYAGEIQDLRPAPGRIDFTDPVRAHWEFVRRYMEEGPEALAGIPVNAVPIHMRKEMMGESVRRILINNVDEPRLLAWLLFIPSMLSVLGRRFAMLTSKIPRWPDRIEPASSSGKR